MKKITSAVFAATPAFAMVAFLGACSPGSDGTAKDEVAGKADMSGVVDSASPPVMAAKASLVEQKDDALEFRYGYPAEAAAIPKLAQHLDQERDAKRLKATEQAQADRTQALANNFPVRAHILSQTWKKVAQTPRFLSLSSDVESYEGGAHGMVAFASLIWDRSRNKAMNPLDIFTSASAFDAAVEKDFCAGIAAAKQKKGIESVDGGSDTFDMCPRASEQTIWLGSSDGKRIDRLTIGITAYVVGPYAEGNYRINVPMTATLARIVKPQYASDIRART